MSGKLELKGQILLAKAKVVASAQPIANLGVEVIHDPPNKHYRKRKLYRIPFQDPVQVLVVGKTYRATGEVQGGFGYDDAAYLVEDKRHPVWAVVPFSEKAQRYYKPFVVLEDDLMDSE